MNIGEVYIDGVSQTAFGKDTRKLEIMLADVGKRALIHSKCKDSPDLVYIGNYNYLGYADQGSLDALVGEELRKKIASTTPVFHVDRGSASGAAAVEAAFEHAKAGKRVLVISGEKMFLEDADRRKITEETSKMMGEKERKFGLTMATIAAIATTEYMIRYGINKSDIQDIFFRILNKNREYGSKNKYAYFKKLVSKEDYFDREKNPWVAEPLTKNDCAGTYNGAAAVYLVPNETDIKLSGIKSAFSTIKTEEKYTLTSLDATVDAARELYQETGLNPHEIDIVELHDAFQPVPILAVEDLGFVERGRGTDFILNEANKNGKKIFYNRSGGFFSKTHPLAASGTAQLVELVLQMRGENQYSKMLKDYQSAINRGLWFSMEGFGYYNVIGIIEKTKNQVEKEGLREENLPEYLKHGGIIKRYRERGTVAGSTSSPEKTGFAVVKNWEGKLQLVSFQSSVKLDEKVKVVKADIPYIKVSEQVSEILKK
ncbi:MAG: thiolase family protein [Candidatus Aminicenantes bacterium]|nr:thiolase family protein [Candidatus Aminicenantes bacterium]